MAVCLIVMMVVDRTHPVSLWCLPINTIIHHNSQPTQKYQQITPVAFHEFARFELVAHVQPTTLSDHHPQRHWAINHVCHREMRAERRRPTAITTRTRPKRWMLLLQRSKKPQEELEVAYRANSYTALSQVLGYSKKIVWFQIFGVCRFPLQYYLPSSSHRSLCMVKAIAC